MLHACAPLNLVGLLVDNEALVRHHCPNFVFLLLAADEEDFVLSLDGREVLGDDVSVPEIDGRGCLGPKLVDQQLLALFVEVMQPGLVGLQDEVWLKADNVVKKAAEFVDFTSDLNHRPGVLLDEDCLALDLLGECLRPRRELMEPLPLLQHLQVLHLLAQLALLRYPVLNFVLKRLKLDEGLLGEVLGRRLILLHALEVLDDVLGLKLLLVDDCLQLVVLLVHFFEDLLLQTLLTHHAVLHVRARLQRFAALRQNGFELGYLAGGGLLERLALLTGAVVGEVAIIAQRHVMRLAEDGKLLVMGAVSDLSLEFLLALSRSVVYEC